MNGKPSDMLHLFDFETSPVEDLVLRSPSGACTSTIIAFALADEGARDWRSDMKSSPILMSASLADDLVASLVASVSTSIRAPRWRRTPPCRWR